LTDLLGQLYRLQTRIRFVHEREKRRDTVPPDLVEVDREYQDKGQAVAALKSRLTEAELEKRKAEGELADHKEKLKKYPYYIPPTFPPSGLFSKPRSEAALERRKQLLHVYLLQLAAVDEVRDTNAFSWFINPDVVPTASSLRDFRVPVRASALGRK